MPPKHTRYIRISTPTTVIPIFAPSRCRSAARTAWSFSTRSHRMAVRRVPELTSGLTTRRQGGGIWSPPSIRTRSPDAQPYLPADNASCRGACVAQADITDGDVDFLVQGENSTLANGLSVISVRSGQWRMVPFLDKPPATSSNPYVPAAELVDQDIRVSLDDLSVTYRYDPIQQAFAGAIADPTPTPTPAPSPVTSPSSEPGPTVSVNELLFAEPEHPLRRFLRANQLLHHRAEFRCPRV